MANSIFKGAVVGKEGDKTSTPTPQTKPDSAVVKQNPVFERQPVGSVEYDGRK